MLLNLTVIKGQDDGKTFEVRENEAKLLGRSSKSGIRIHDLGISRLHCQVANDGRRCVVTDMNSKNGTSLNGLKITGEVELHTNDCVEIGTTILHVTVESGTTQAPTGEVVSLVENASGPLVAEAAPVAENGGLLRFEFRSNETPAPPPVTGAAPPEAEAPAENGLMGSFDRFVPGEEAGRNDAENHDQEDIAVELEEVPATKGEPDPYVGQLIGGFRVEERLGEDALSVSYRAMQLSMDRAVLLRILKGPMTREESSVRRFLDAACAGGRLVHPHILQVYDAGKAGSTYYIALEYVDGKNVNVLIREQGAGNPLPVAQVVEIGSQIAGALAYAHSQGVVHGRITPGVIYVTHHGIAKIADLGFARALVESGLEAEGAAARRVVLSQFIAPEQLSESPVTDERSDVYSLAVVLYVMFSGRLPFPAKGGALRLKIAEGGCVPVRQASPSLPRALSAVVEKAMSLNPAGRYGEISHIQQDLRDAST